LRIIVAHSLASSRGQFEPVSARSFSATMKPDRRDSELSRYPASFIRFSTPEVKSPRTEYSTGSASMLHQSPGLTSALGGWYRYGALRSDIF
jgi:hypothetical protein